MISIKETLTPSDYQGAANLLDIPAAIIKAVFAVECPKAGFDPEGFPITLFEGHKFHKFTNGQYAIEFPNLSYPKWDRKQYGKTWKEEKARLAMAMSLDREAAIMSASWGKPQIMGFNHQAAGCASLQLFVNRMCESESSQLLLFCMFLMHEGLTPFLKRKDWANFALRYNGAGYKENKYDEKLAAAYKLFSSSPAIP